MIGMPVHLRNDAYYCLIVVGVLILLKVAAPQVLVLSQRMIEASCTTSFEIGVFDYLANDADARLELSRRFEKKSSLVGTSSSSSWPNQLSDLSSFLAFVRNIIIIVRPPTRAELSCEGRTVYTSSSGGGLLAYQVNSIVLTPYYYFAIYGR
jgi:hypothetical protein